MAHDHQHGHQHDHAEAHDDHEHDDVQHCIEECLNCHAACTMTAQHCLAEGGALAELNLVGVLLDCAELAQTSANFMLRGSPYHALTCGACAELCRACEEACRSAAGGDEQLTQCAEVCASCAEACEQMANAEEEEEEDEEE